MYKPSISRRTFIQRASILAGGSLLVNSALQGFNLPKKTSVIIIGAGFAGLAAANVLRKNNIEFTILEARNRIGGRVFSHSMDTRENLVVELGAEWIGDSHHRVRTLSDELGLQLLNNQFDTHLIYQGRYFRHGEWDYSEAWKQTFRKLLDKYPQLSEQEKLQLDAMDWWRYLINNGCDGRDLDLRELLDSTDFGESIRHVSALAALAEYAESSEKNEMDWKIAGGNSLFAEKLADRIGRSNIRLQHTVNRIVQDKQVTVYCDSGQIFQADKLICTIPTFAMRKINWEPLLPREKEEAINELQYARINKNPLLFRKRFWKEENFDMVTDTLTHYFYHATKSQPSAKGVLLSYTIGEKAAVIANQSDSWKAETIQQTLGPYFGNVKKLLEKQANYYWGGDAYSHGAYALYGTGQWFRVMPVLKKPFLHTFFAGEHLAEWQGFMEGAVNTGEEAAEMIVL